MNASFRYENYEDIYKIIQREASVHGFDIDDIDVQVSENTKTFTIKMADAGDVALSLIPGVGPALGTFKAISQFAQSSDLDENLSAAVDEAVNQGMIPGQMKPMYLEQLKNIFNEQIKKVEQQMAEYYKRNPQLAPKYSPPTSVAPPTQKAPAPSWSFPEMASEEDMREKYAETPQQPGKKQFEEQAGFFGNLLNWFSSSRIVDYLGRAADSLVQKGYMKSNEKDQIVNQAKDMLANGITEKATAEKAEKAKGQAPAGTPVGTPTPGANPSAGNSEVNTTNTVSDNMVPSGVGQEIPPQSTGLAVNTTKPIVNPELTTQESNIRNWSLKGDRSKEAILPLLMEGAEIIAPYVAEKGVEYVADKLMGSGKKEEEETEEEKKAFELVLMITEAELGEIGKSASLEDFVLRAAYWHSLREIDENLFEEELKKKAGVIDIISTAMKTINGSGTIAGLIAGGLNLSKGDYTGAGVSALLGATLGTGAVVGYNLGKQLFDSPIIGTIVGALAFKFLGGAATALSGESKKDEALSEEEKEKKEVEQERLRTEFAQKSWPSVKDNPEVVRATESYAKTNKIKSPEEAFYKMVTDKTQLNRLYLAYTQQQGSLESSNATQGVPWQ